MIEEYDSLIARATRDVQGNFKQELSEINRKATEYRRLTQNKRANLVQGMNIKEAMSCSSEMFDAFKNLIETYKEFLGKRLEAHK